MNWRAGLFRIWILFSVVLIAAWAIYGFSKWKNSTVTYDVTDPSGLKFTVQAPRGTSESEVGNFAHDLDTVKKRQVDCAKDRGPWCDYAMPLEMPIDQAWVLPGIVGAVGGTARCVLCRSCMLLGWHQASNVRPVAKSYSNLSAKCPTTSASARQGSGSMLGSCPVFVGHQSALLPC